MKIFITGQDGEIGRDICPLIENYEVVGFDLASGSKYDTRNIEALRELMPEGVDMVIHLANIPHPQPGRAVEDFQTINVEGTRNVLTVAQEKDAGSILFISSLAALGFDVPWAAPKDRRDGWPKGEAPWDEEGGVPLPIDAWDLEPYGVSKTAQEDLIRESGLRHLILRCGPYGDGGVNPFVADAMSKPFLVPVIKKVLANGGILESNLIHVCKPGMWGGEKLREFLDV